MTGSSRDSISFYFHIAVCLLPGFVYTMDVKPPATFIPSHHFLAERKKNSFKIFGILLAIAIFSTEQMRH